MVVNLVCIQTGVKQANLLEIISLQTESDESLESLLLLMESYNRDGNQEYERKSFNTSSKENKVSKEAIKNLVGEDKPTHPTQATLWLL